MFVGVYIDRGPKIRNMLEMMKAMVDSNNAIALMGNHEYNALWIECMSLWWRGEAFDVHQMELSPSKGKHRVTVVDEEGNSLGVEFGVE